jgi:carboxylesterase type B
LAGWKAEKAQTNAVGATMFGGASAATRSYSNAKGDTVEISITGDSAMVMQFAPMLNNPAMAGAMGKLIRVGSQRAIQNQDGDVMMMIANRFLINVQGSADAAAKLAYAQALDVAKLSKM